MKNRFYATKSAGLYENSWAVWERVGRNRQQICIVLCGGRNEARKIATLLNGVDK